MLGVLEIEAAGLKLAQPGRPPAAIEGKCDGCKQMLPPTGQSGDVRSQSRPSSAIIRLTGLYMTFSSTHFPVSFKRSESVFI